ncbi:MAG: hypothetical protein MI753_14150 [Hyphomicrobiales bacterium]|nr:hypothetical protein [Hyphomicrobiales bacterium]
MEKQSHIEFQEALDRLGANPETWPDAERQWAERLLADDLETAWILRRAQAFDRLICDAADAPRAGSADIGRIMERIALEKNGKPFKTFLRRFFIISSGAACASFAAGVWLGVMAPGLFSAMPEVDYAASASAFGLGIGAFL